MIRIEVNVLPTGKLWVTPKEAITDEVRQFISANKPGLIAVGGKQVMIFATEEESTAETTERWRVQLPAETLSVHYASGAGLATVEAHYPDALAIERWPELDDLAPAAPITAPERAEVLAWLTHIEETDPEAIANTLTRCEQDAGARDYFIGRARLAPQERAQQLLAEAPAEQTHAYAVLYPDADPVLVGVAVRGKGSCTLAVSADRYDPFRLLELVGQHNVKAIMEKAA